MPYLKPSACEGCPFHTKGRYFTPDVVVPGSAVYILAQNPGPDEEEGLKLTPDGRQYVQPQPLIGATGALFDQRFLPLSGLKRDEVSLGNALRCRPGLDLGLKDANSLPPIPTTVRLEDSNADIVKALKHCRDAYFKPPASVKTIVTMGRYAMFSLTGIQNEDTEYARKQGVMESWRGYGVDVPSFQDFRTVDTTHYHDLTSETRIFFTQHIAALFRDKRYFHATLEDFNRLRLLLAHKWPLPLPSWSVTPPTTWPAYAAFDTEFLPDTNELTMWSLCDIRNLTRLYCVQSAHTPHSHIPMEQGSTIVFQNVHADILHLSVLVDLTRVTLHDMMLAHSVLWTGEPHNLNYIQSKYGTLNRYKHLSSSKPELYSACDSHQPAWMWKHHFIPGFMKDRASWEVYTKYRLKTIPIITKAHATGSRLNGARLREVQTILTEHIEEYQQQARILTNDPLFKLGGQKLMKRALYDDVYVPDPLKIKKPRKTQGTASADEKGMEAEVS